MVEKPVVAAVVVDGRRVMAAQRCGGAMAGKWEFPGGKVESGETFREALRREMREEFGAAVTVGAKILEIPFRVDGVAFRLIAYYVRLLSGAFLPLEHRAVCWLAPEQLSGVDWTPADVAVARRVRDHYRLGSGPWRRAGVDAAGQKGRLRPSSPDGAVFGQGPGRAAEKRPERGRSERR